MRKFIAVVIIAVVSVFLFACKKSSTPAAQPAKDALESRLQALAGSGATNCGRPNQGSDPKPASDCAMQAAQAKKPFYVAYDMPGLTVGIAGNSEGKLTTAQAQTGPSQTEAKVTDYPCDAELRIAQSGRVTCVAPGAGMGMSMGMGGANPHGGMTMPPTNGENPHGDMMAAPPGTPNPHGSMTTKPDAAGSHGSGTAKSH